MSHKKHKILLVDDDPGNLNFLRLAFRDDFLVLMARNGGEAFEILTLPENSDTAIILTDERMPGMSGLELLEKTLITHPHTIRWLITAYPETSSSIYGASLIYIDRFIRKPLKDKIDDLKEDAMRAVELYRLRLEKRIENIKLPDCEQGESGE